MINCYLSDTRKKSAVDKTTVMLIIMLTVFLFTELPQGKMDYDVMEYGSSTLFTVQNESIMMAVGISLHGVSGAR